MKKPKHPDKNWSWAYGKHLRPYGKRLVHGTNRMRVKNQIRKELHTKDDT